MKKILVLLPILFLSLSLRAQYRESQLLLDRLAWNDEKLNIFLDTRFDLNSTIDNGDFDNISFRGQSLKLWVTGELVPGIRYRLRHSLNKSLVGDERDNLANATDHAWIAFDIGEHWTLTAGKQSVQIGTFENDYHPADVYLGSMVYNDFDGYQVGLDAALKYYGQVFHMQVFNSDYPMFASADYKNKALGFALMWEGNLLDKALRTRWGYSGFQHTKTKFYQWLTLGTQINIRNFTTELDYYLGNRDMDYSDVVAVDDFSLRYVQDQSVSVNFEYKIEKFRPFVKGTWNERYDKRLDATAYRLMSIQGGIEYYPFTSERLDDMRVHLVYGFEKTGLRGDFRQYGNNLYRHTIIFGMRWLFKAK